MPGLCCVFGVDCYTWQNNLALPNDDVHDGHAGKIAVTPQISKPGASGLMVECGLAGEESSRLTQARVLIQRRQKHKRVKNVPGRPFDTGQYKSGKFKVLKYT